MIKLIKYLLYIGKLSALKQAEILIKEASITANINYGKASMNHDDRAMYYFDGQKNAYDGLIIGIHKAIKNLEKEYKEG